MAGRAWMPPARAQRTAAEEGATTAAARTALRARSPAYHSAASVSGYRVTLKSSASAPQDPPRLATTCTAACWTKRAAGTQSSSRPRGSRHACAAMAGASWVQLLVSQRRVAGQSRRALAATKRLALCMKAGGA